MGIVRQHIRVANAAKPDLEEVDANALVDSGAMELCLPEHVAIQLKLQKVDEREITVADGRRQLVPYVGPVRVEVFGRNTFAGALVLGDEVLLGAIPMQGMDVLVDPRRERLIPNPENPNIPGAVAKGHVVERGDKDA